MRSTGTIARAIIACAIASNSGSSFAALSKLGSQKISASVQSLLESKEGGVDAIILLDTQGDLRGAKRFNDRKAKLRYSYDILSTVARSHQKGLVQFLDAKKAQYQRFYVANMVAVFDADQALLDAIAQRPEVLRILNNEPVKALPQVVKEFIPSFRMDALEPNIAAIGADKVWQEFAAEGEGIVVAGQDTGVEWTHPALKNQYRGVTGESVDHRYSWHDAIKAPIEGSGNPCGYNTAAPCDDNDHGTHTIGTVVGSDGGQNKIGVAPKAKWIACRNMDAGVGRPTTYIECFEWFLAPYAPGEDPMTQGKPELAPHVINNSWGCPPEEGCHEAEILPVLKNLRGAGIMVVASAGNEGPGCSTIASPPAMHSEDSFSVGAHDFRTGRIASFSSRGPSAFDGAVGPDVSAPGVRIRSSVTGGGYSGDMWSGTSMAGPHVAGQVALLWSAVPQLQGDVERTAEVIRKSSTATASTQACGGVAGDAVPNNVFGYGRINTLESVKLAKQLSTSFVNERVECRSRVRRGRVTNCR